ncbi:class I SAM-dependent methyltransferase [Microbacterium telephonicum]|uniref:16S rRNA (Guanine1207-N2)-methyltransferase n=1 Tax=Microbacterium telephonicum TaxID=1714841 RepID=A0A498C750_9MICO|nr:methyltransferase [Microbacterium telephonicum]RLK48910.1 16S rRNA (guanine1207-N2)-methyltransferase [Microbacterium telephonicum]
MSFPFERLRRFPDIEADDLVAADAADRLILDESAPQREGLGPGELVVIGDGYGALTLASLADGAPDVRVHQDTVTGERALAANAAALGLAGYTSLPLDARLLRGARVVLLRLPRALDALADIAGLIAAHAREDVVVVAGGRLKHMTPTMNNVLRTVFGRVDVSHARQKSRVLIARSPHDGHDPVPRVERVDGIEVHAFGGAFAGPRIDIGTRLLLRSLPDTPPGGTAEDPLIDFACGTGVVATTLALRHPGAAVYASDTSAVAVASARASVAANGVAAQVRVAQDDLLSARADGSASFIALNPPFHSGAAVTDRLAPRLFADAGRVLRPWGELWCVWNTPLGYRPMLERLVGPTRQVSRNPKFTVTVSLRR